MKNYVKVIMCKFRNGINCWQISKSITLCIFAPALAVSDTLTLKIVKLKKVGNGKGVNYFQYYYYYYINFHYAHIFE